MKLWSRLIFAAAAMAVVGLFGVMLMTQRAEAQAKMAPAAKGKTAGEVFKNVTTNALKGLTPDDFLAAMGVMADDLGLDCADCHPGAGTDKVDWVIDTPPKRTARRMVDMMQAINMTNFNGAQRVTCWTCHHGRETPASTIALDALYSNPNGERDDILQAAAPGQPTATQILDKYIAAVGGAQKLAGLTSFIATGVSVGYEGLGGNGEFTVYSKAPNQRTTQIRFPDHPERGQSTWTYDGTTGWILTPRGLLGEFEVTGSGLEGTRIEAMLAFPGQIKTIATWRAGAMESMGTRDFNVIQGTGPKGLLVTLYFDTETNLLVRMIRYTASPVGRVPTQIDYSDYRDVGGIKFPFEYSFLWLDGRYTAKINSVKTNVAIDAKVFGKP
jgi:photosynthetic reaction center cytochrome c subunit